MARKSSVKSQKPKSKTSKAMFTIPPVPRTGLFAFLAAFAGIVAAVPLTVAVMMPMVRQDVASAVSSANKGIVALAPAADTLSCTQPAAVATSSPAGHVLGANTVAAPPAGNQGGSGGGGNGSTTTYVHKLVSGILTSSGTIGNTGPNSNNVVTTTQTATTTVTNNNNLTFTNTNSQNSSTGNASANSNTSAGTTSTGDASNTNSSSFDIKVSN